MKLNYACHVDIGIRESNDDRCLVDGRIFDQSAGSGALETPAVAVVCDGCGGYAGGGIAAHTVLSVLNQALPQALSQKDALEQALEAAAEAVFARKEEDPDLFSMCTTIAGCVFTEDSTLIFHAGDSRVYRYDGYGLTRMTLDHSVVQTMINMGQLTEEQARVSPNRNVITRCIGVECLPPDISVSRVPISPGEAYLICSDGLWDFLTDDQIAILLATACDDPEDTVRRLVMAALNAGSNDNVTVCLCVCPGSFSMEESTPFILD